MTRFGARNGGDSPWNTPRNEDLVAAGVTLGWGALSHWVIPERIRPWAGVGAALGFTVVARAVGADRRELGIAREDLASGLRVGAIAAGAIAVATATGRALDRNGSAFRDERVTNASTAEAAAHLLVRIPLATALVEELVFRGIILGFGLRDGDRRRALLVSSIAFGLWHVGAALHPDRQAGHQLSSTAAAVVGDVVATTIGGLGFGWLRMRSNSIVAPAIAHAALNSSAYVATRIGRGTVRTASAR